MYEAREKRQGQRSDLIATLGHRAPKLHARIKVAQEQDVDPRTVTRAAVFAQAVDALDRLVPGFRNITLAEEWILANQLGRRNLTDNWRAYLLGKLYEAREKRQGQRSDLSATSDHSDRKLGACAETAIEAGVAEPTVRRAAAFARAVDTLDQLAPGFREVTLAEGSRAV